MMHFLSNLIAMCSGVVWQEVHTSIHNHDTFAKGGTQVGLLKHPNHNGLHRLLEDINHCFGPSVARLDIQGELPHQPGEHKSKEVIRTCHLEDECVSALQVLADFMQGEQARKVAVARPMPKHHLACCLAWEVAPPLQHHFGGLSCFACRT